MFKYIIVILHFKGTSTIWSAMSALERSKLERADGQSFCGDWLGWPHHTWSIFASCLLSFIFHFSFQLRFIWTSQPTDVTPRCMSRSDYFLEILKAALVKRRSHVSQSTNTGSKDHLHGHAILRQPSNHTTYTRYIWNHYQLQFETVRSKAE